MSQLPFASDPPDPDGAQVASDLRAASDALLHELDRLYELESRKRALQPDDPEFVRLAREVQDVARLTLRESQRQEVLANDVADRVKRGRDESLDQPIQDIPPGSREAMLILTEWRAAERELAAAAPGSAEEQRAREAVERLRAEYAATISFRDDGGLGEL